MPKIASADLNIKVADLRAPPDQQAIIELTNAYAREELGNSHGLPQEVLDRLIPALQNHPTTIVFIARVRQHPAGIANCFLGFSTFAAKSLMNVHDLAVLPEYRGQGIGRALLHAVEAEAKKRDCVKLTLEVLEHNARARGLYESFGFRQAVYRAEQGGSLFFSKCIE